MKKIQPIDKHQRILDSVSGPLKFLIGIILIILSIQISKHCIDPEDASLFDNVPYAAVQFFVILDIAIIYVLLFLAGKLLGRIPPYKSLCWHDINNIFFWAVLIHFTANAALREIGRFILPEYRAALLSQTPQYACQELPVSIYTAIHIFF